MNCPVCESTKLVRAALPGAVYLCDDCEAMDADARKMYAHRPDACNMDPEIRSILNLLHGVLMEGGASFATLEAAWIDALNAERRLILREMLRAQDLEGLIQTVSDRLGKEK